MEDLSTKSLKELAELTRDSEDKAVLRAVAEQVGVTFSGNTGVSTLKEKILAELILDEEPDAEPDEDEVSADSSDPIMAALAQHREDPSPEVSDIYVKEEAGQKLSKKFSVAEMMEMDASKIKDDTLRRNVIRTQALRMVRVKITNLDPSDANVPGAIVTCYSKYTGKVTKYIPYDEEQHPNGYHIQKMILDDLKTRTFNLRKEIKTAGSSFGVKQYKTTKVRKFAIEELPPLTKDELKNLAKQQAATGSIDRAA